jgi:signal transduction histidine kinase/ligand-binding sensor domain-containing protein
MNPRLIILLLLILTIAPRPLLQAQQTITLAFNPKLGPADGLSSYNASKVLQDKYGFIWIATQDGLNRFDGNRFIIYNKTSEPAHRLLGNVINETIIDTVTNTLWVTTSYGGLNGIDLITGKVTHALRAELVPIGFQNAWLKCFSFCEGLIWIGTYEGVTVYDPVKRKFVEIEKLPFKANTSFVFSDAYKNVWMFFPDFGIAVYSAKTRKKIRFYSANELGIHERKGFLQFPGRMARPNDTSFVLAVNNEFRLIKYDKDGVIQSNELLPVSKAIRGEYIYACALDRSGNLWFSTGNKLLVTKLNWDFCVTVRDIAGGKDQSDWLNFISHIFFDSENNLWVGCQRGFAYAKLDPPAFSPFFESEDKTKKIQHVNYIYTANDTLLYACATNGLFIINRISNKMVNVRPQSAGNFMFKNIDNNLIVSLTEGVYVFKNKSTFVPVSHVYPELLLLDKNQINSAVIVGDSLVIMGSENNKGLFIWNIQKHTLNNYEDISRKLNSSIINNLYKDQKDRLWILSDNSISIWDIRANRFSTFNFPDPDLKIPLNILLDVCEAKGYYWMAVYGKGIVQLDSNREIIKIYSSPEGLLNTGVYKVFPYKDSVLFVTSNNGLFSLNIGTQKIHQYLTEDGLNSSHFEERCGFTINNRYYIGGVDGFSRLNPELVRSNTKAPDIFITELKTEYETGSRDTFNLDLTSYTIASAVLQTTIMFSAINYSNPKKVIYAYRIQGLNNDWTEIGSRNFITFLGISPGTYTLDIRAANEDGIWGKPRQIKLIFLPKWYQTVLFKILLIFLVATLLYVIYHYRMMQLKKQQQIRRDIANDLHDDIGSTLNAVKIFTHLAKKEPANNGHLNNIEMSLKQVSVSLRDIIWVLDDSLDTIYEVIERIKKFAVPICQANQIDFHSRIEVHSKNTSLSKTEKRNFLLIAKECITNSLKYSRCRSITIHAKEVDNKISLQLSDDGCGFDSSILTEGNGLKNMGLRAKQIKAVCKIDSAPGAGTVITIEQK